MDCHNFVDEESIPPVVSSVYGEFREPARPPLYDGYEENCSKYEGPKGDSSSHSSNTKSIGQ